MLRLESLCSHLLLSFLLFNIFSKTVVSCPSVSSKLTNFIPITRTDCFICMNNLYNLMGISLN